MKQFLLSISTLATLVLVTNNNSIVNNVDANATANNVLTKQWNDNSNVNNDVNYAWSDQYGFSSYHDNSDKYILLDKWRNYTHDWFSFTNKYPTFNFDTNSKFIVSTAGTTAADVSNLANNVSTAKITTVITSLFHIHTYYKSPFIPHIPASAVELTADLDFWNDNTNIYFQLFLKVKCWKFWYCFFS